MAHVSMNPLRIALVAVICATVTIAAVCPLSAAPAKRPLMRFPDIHGDTVVFVYGEDIWTVPAAGGTATRLTIHDGAERYPKFSPDGEWVAFTGEYDGNTDVYVMNVHGGEITRVTWHPGRDEVIGWHPTSGKIMFSSSRNSFNRFTHLFLIDPGGTGLEELIMHEAARGCFSPDGSKIAYNRLSRESRTWKRYYGGTAQEIYIFDFDEMKDRKITSFDGTDRLPMWIGEKIFFSSDRDGVLNIFSVDPATGDVTKLTDHRKYDVRRPSEGGSKIVYELGGTLRVLDTETGSDSEVPVEIRADAPELRPYYKKVDGYMTGGDISPSGNRVVVAARGELFSVPKEEGPTRNLSKDCGANDKDPAWSPDGKWIAFFSDRDGEYNLYVVDPLGEEAPRKLTSFDDGYRHTLRWSPDSKHLAFTDQTLTLYVIDVASKKLVKVDRAEYENIDVAIDLKPIYDFAWSPDSRWIAYSKMNADLVTQVHVYSLDSGKTRSVSDGLFNDFMPAFSCDGKRLFFVSNRRFNPTLCDFEWEMVYKKVAGIYALALTPGAGPLFPPKSDEAAVTADEPEQNGEKNDKKNDGGVTVEIDFDGIASRLEMLPLERGNYRRLQTGGGNLFFLNKDEGDFNRFEFRDPGPMDLYRFDCEKKEAVKVTERVRLYRLSADGKKVMFGRRRFIAIADATAKETQGEKVDLDDVVMRIDPIREWRQIFNEAWRMERDFYYEPKMHGLDWDAMHAKYMPLLESASCRQDVQYVIGELIGELATSHTYVFGGDIRRDNDYHVGVGLLGIDWEADLKAGRYRITKVYREPDWSREMAPPLARPGIDVEAGEYLLAVNGEEITTERNLYTWFVGLAREQVTILVNDRPTMKGAREYTVEPASNEYVFRHNDWLERNRALVDEASNGEIGYLYFPDTYLGSCREFGRFYYGQMRKKGLVVDARFNGGGLDPAIFLNRLAKDPLGFWTRRYSHDQTNPATITMAHLACLTNRQAGSGGDMFPMEFQMMELGPVIGTRTWGGLVGVSQWIPLIDGGGLSAPDYRIYSPDGKWVVENEGVTPDIIVDLDPVEMSRGHDAQLMKAIEVLENKIENDPRSWPQHPPYPKQR